MNLSARRACRLCLVSALGLVHLLAQSPTGEPVFDGTRALQHVSALATPGKRPAASDRSAQAAAYIKAQFEACGLTVTEHRFPMLAFDEKQTRLSAAGAAPWDIPASAFLYSPSGHLTAEVVAVPEPGLAGDFGRVDLKGKIALVKRGGIWLREKALAAARAGASAVLIYNTSPLPFLGTLRGSVPIPALALSGQDGAALLEALGKGPLTLRLDSETTIETRSGVNLIATRPGSSEKTFVFGAHYDSVTNSSGANDNASGTAVLLELARVLAKSPRPETFQFMAFDGEEEGLLGSSAYVNQLTRSQRKAIQAMVNFDELGAGDSPYAVDGEANLVQKAIQAAKRLNKEARQEDSGSGSDHASFADAGIPVLFIYREDALFHTPKDTVDRVKPEWLEAAGRIALEVMAP